MPARTMLIVRFGEEVAKKEVRFSFITGPGSLDGRKKERYLTVQMYGLFASVLANFIDKTGTPRSCSINLGSRLPTRDPASDATTIRVIVTPR
jgi:hypothetical protein